MDEVPVLARTVRGIEWIAREEVRSRLGVGRVELGHRELRFAAPLGSALLELGTVDDAFVVVREVDGVTRRRDSLARLASLRVDLDSIARLLGRSGPRTFDVVASFLGRRNYNRFELEDVLGRGLAAVSGWAYLSRSEGSPARGELSLRVHVAGSVATLAVRIARVPLHRRTYRVAGVPGSLHPPLARALALVAGVRPGGKLVDPFCGAGTIPIEAAVACPGLTVTGFDLDDEALAAARRNAAAAGVDLALAHADAGALPLPDGAADCVVANPPWGAAVAAAGLFRSDPAAVARELERVLAARGRLALLTRSAFPRGRLEVLLETRVRVSGMLAELIVLGRKAEDT